MNPTSKVNIPRSHYLFYRKVYGYLHGTLASKAAAPKKAGLAPQLIDEYRRHEAQQVALGGPQNEASNKKPSSASLEADSPFRAALLGLREQVEHCQKCPLCEKRKHFASFGTESKVPVMVLVDQPSFYDQMQGLCASDDSGRLLGRIIASLGLPEKGIYITPVVKCGSTEELPYNMEDIQVCEDYLEEELRLVRPKFMLAFGEVTYRFLFGKPKQPKSSTSSESSSSFESILGKALEYRKVPVVFTHHPKALLALPSLKREVWTHLRVYKPTLENLLKEAKGTTSENPKMDSPSSGIHSPHN